MFCILMIVMCLLFVSHNVLYMTCVSKENGSKHSDILLIFK